MSLNENTNNFLLDWQSAELAAVEHMKSLGFIDAQRTQSGADGGIDVDSSEAAAQVKFYANPVGRPDIQRLRGAAHEYRVSVFYSTGGYTKEAKRYADSAGVALFIMDPYGRAEAYSQFAEVLAEPEMIQERRQRLEELKVVRYRFAAVSFLNDLSLYSKFILLVRLNLKEGALYSHVASELDKIVHNFSNAVERREFDEADVLFEEINKRIGFLSWITGSEFRNSYTDLEEAISEGWELESEAGSDFLLQRIATGTFNLIDVALKFLKAWEDHFAEGVVVGNLVDEELRKAAGMLLDVSYDRSILSDELLTQLKATVREGVMRVHDAAVRMFNFILEKYARQKPKHLVSGKLRVGALMERIIRQLDVS